MAYSNDDAAQEDAASAMQGQEQSAGELIEQERLTQARERELAETRKEVRLLQPCRVPGALRTHPPTPHAPS